MDIFQLRYFISATTLGSFSLAATENNISQSSFSKQIMALERELGVTLFSRKRRVISLTPAGHCFLDHAYAILNNYNKMKADLAKFTANDRATISIAAIPVITQYHIIDAIIEYRALRPQVAFSLTEAESSQVMSVLRKMEADFAIMRTDFLDPTQYHISPLVEDRLVALVSTNHPLAQRDRIPLSALRDETLTMATVYSDLHKIVLNACLKAGFTPSVGVTVSGRTDITFDIVRKGEAICLAMEKVMANYPPDGCKLVELEEDILSTTALVWLKAVELSPACRLFRDFLMVHMHP